MTRVITDAESVEALAAEWPEQRPVSSERRRGLNKLLNDFALACMYGDDRTKRMSTSKAIHDYCDALVSERDALAVRVKELEAALWGCIAAIERTHHCTEADRLASADKARAALTTPESKP